MDLSKLQSITTDGLMKIQAAVQEILDTRIDRSMVRGRIGEFTDKTGIKRQIVIRRVNQNSVSGIEVTTSASPGSKWRVSKGGITMQGKEIAGAAPKPFVPAHVPATASADHW